jgi:hypothetical protein
MKSNRRILYSPQFYRGEYATTGTVAPADASVLYQTVAMPTVTIGAFPVTPCSLAWGQDSRDSTRSTSRCPTGVTGDGVPVAVSIYGSVPDTHNMSIQTHCVKSLG